MNGSFLLELTVLILAAFLGLQVISKVPTLLHTPLMSGTNAIHGIVLVGAIIVAGVPNQPTWLRIITLAAVEAMRAGSVIVDLAAETGGNCELTEPGRDVVHGGVTIIGPLNLASEMPYDASRLYARNVQALLTHLAPQGELVLDFEDEITAGACVTRNEGTA